MNYEVNSISNEIVNEVERLLPDILNKLNVDEKFIKHNEIKEKFKMGRTRKKQRKTSQKIIEKRENYSLIQNIKQHVEYFDGKNVINSDYDRNLFISNSNVISDRFEIKDQNFKNGHKLPVNDSEIIKHIIESFNNKKDIKIDKMDITNEEILSPIFLEKESEIISKIKIGSSLKKEIKKNAILSDVINFINNSIKDLIKKYKLEISVHVEQKEDIEYDDWKKIYYHFYIYDDSFNEKIEIWDKLDDFIRNKITEIQSQKYRLGVKSRNVKKINQQIYIDINL